MTIYDDFMMGNNEKHELTDKEKKQMHIVMWRIALSVP